jgi:Domain of unknown function (DUF6484)
MNPADMPQELLRGEAPVETAGALEELLRRAPVHTTPTAVQEQAPPLPAVVVGELMALRDALTPLVVWPGATQAVAARTTVDLHASHIGAHVLLMFEQGDSCKPIVTGVIRSGSGVPDTADAGTVQIEADGTRMILSAREQVVLRCGKASITLTKAGKVLIEGSYLLSRSTGVNRVKGGSVQLN